MAYKEYPLTIWMTGLSGAGKTTLAQRLQHLIVQENQKVFILDGDVLRQGLCCDLSFSLKDRSENIRRTANVARLLNEAGVTVIVALISPMIADRANARAVIGNAHFVETYLSADLGACEQRDPKGLYRKARSGLIPDFTGISSPYEPPPSPEIVVDTIALSENESAVAIFHQLIAMLNELKK